MNERSTLFNCTNRVVAAVALGLAGPASGALVQTTMKRTELQHSPSPRDRLRARVQLREHGAGTALSEVEVAVHFMGRGAWKRRLPQVIDMLVALGLARKAKGKAQSV